MDAVAAVPAWFADQAAVLAAQEAARRQAAAADRRRLLSSAFNAVACWVSQTIRERHRICKLAGFDDPLQVADKRFAELTPAELAHLREWIAAHLQLAGPTWWGFL